VYFDQQGLVSNHMLAVTTSGHLVSISSGLANETSKQTLVSARTPLRIMASSSRLNYIWRHEKDNCEMRSADVTALDEVGSTPLHLHSLDILHRLSIS
jgi:hypothetical protein